MKAQEAKDIADQFHQAALEDHIRSILSEINNAAQNGKYSIKYTIGTGTFGRIFSKIAIHFKGLGYCVAEDCNGQTTEIDISWEDVEEQEMVRAPVPLTDAQKKALDKGASQGW